jgi:hypothetical protein
MRSPVVRLLTVERKLRDGGVTLAARAITQHDAVSMLANLADEVAQVRKRIVSDSVQSMKQSLANRRKTDNGR